MIFKIKIECTFLVILKKEWKNITYNKKNHIFMIQAPMVNNSWLAEIVVYNLERKLFFYNFTPKMFFYLLEPQIWRLWSFIAVSFTKYELWPIQNGNTTPQRPKIAQFWQLFGHLLYQQLPLSKVLYRYILLINQENMNSFYEFHYKTKKNHQNLCCEWYKNVSLVIHLQIYKVLEYGQNLWYFA